MSFSSTSPLRRHYNESDMGDYSWESTVKLAAQWIDLSNVIAIFLLLGADSVHKALAQGAGPIYTPVCLSCGWLAYSFSSMSNVIANGSLLPTPDYPTKIINLKTGYVRDNSNWIVGRLLRDHEARVSRGYPPVGNGIRIAVYEADDEPVPATHRLNKMQLLSLIVTIIQLVMGAIPLAYSLDWTVMLVVSAGIGLTQLSGYGIRTQWMAEKLPKNKKSNNILALTTGNGSKDILVVVGNGQCADLEELSTPRTPRYLEFWRTAFETTSRTITDNSLPSDDVVDGQTKTREIKQIFGMPVTYVKALLLSIALTILWAGLLVIIPAVGNWGYITLLILVTGTVANAGMAAMEQPPEKRGIPMTLVDIITATNIMDGIMDFHWTYKCGRPLLHEFIPGNLHPSEAKWWNGDDPNIYDSEREKHSLRGTPRRFFPQFYPLGADLDNSEAPTNTLEPKVGDAKSSAPSRPTTAAVVAQTGMVANLQATGTSAALPERPEMLRTMSHEALDFVQKAPDWTRM